MVDGEADRRCPVRSSVCHDWDWNLRKILSMVVFREMKQQRAVLIHPVVFDKSSGVSLVHVNVVDAVSWVESEDFVAPAAFRPPPYAESVELGRGVVDCPLYLAIQFLVEVVVGAGNVVWQCGHVFRVEETRPDVIEGWTSGRDSMGCHPYSRSTICREPDAGNWVSIR